MPHKGNFSIIFYDLFEDLDLNEYFITSKAEKILSNEQNELKIEVKKTSGSKCPRCWKILNSSCNRCESVNLENN